MPSMATGVPRFKDRTHGCIDQCCANVKRTLTLSDLEMPSACCDYGAKPGFGLREHPTITDDRFTTREFISDLTIYRQQTTLDGEDDIGRCRLRFLKKSFIQSI